MTYDFTMADFTLLAALPWLSVKGWIVLIAAVTNIACAVIGCFLVLRRMSMMGDALSHAVLPGLAIAFILSNSYSILPLFLGALAAGLLTTFLSQTLHQYAGVPSDASMGVVFTSLFALGVVLIKKGIPNVHFDIGCVYEGALEYTPWNTIEVLNYDIPRAFIVIVLVLTLNLMAIVLLWKELKLSSFDPALATTMGLSATAMHYLLMALVSLTTVASFEAVGSILVVAMLIVPAATAHLLCDRLSLMVLLSALVGAASAVLGYWAAKLWDTNIAGMITVAAGLLYALAVLFSPHYGVTSTLIRNLRMSLRVLREDLLAMLYRVEELGSEKTLSTSEATTAVGGGWLVRWGIGNLVRNRRVDWIEGRLQLTEQGRQDARKLVRSHRLWETYLVEYLGMPLDHVHEPAHRVEHYIDEELQQKLEAKLDTLRRDPHGREIPE